MDTERHLSAQRDRVRADRDVALPAPRAPWKWDGLMDHHGSGLPRFCGAGPCLLGSPRLHWGAGACRSGPWRWWHCRCPTAVSIPTPPTSNSPMASRPACAPFNASASWARQGCSTHLTTLQLTPAAGHHQQIPAPEISSNHGQSLL